MASALVRNHFSSEPSMSSHREVCTEIAESILEHAESIGRLDARGMDEDAYEAAYVDHVSAMRLLAVPHMDPQPDLELVRRLKSLAGGVPGVQVQVADGAIQLIIDSAQQQHRVKLWNRRQLAKNEEDDFEGDWTRRFE